MDRNFQSIANIVEESNKLNKLQDDLIKLNGDLSKLEAGLGNVPSASEEAWKANKMEELIQKIADDYKQFIEDLAEVEKKGVTISITISRKTFYLKKISCYSQALMNVFTKIQISLHYKELQNKRILLI